MSDVANFYEDDEPVADVAAAFKRGKKGKTALRNKVTVHPSSLLNEGTSSTVGVRKVSRLTVPPATRPRTATHGAVSA